MRNPCRFLCQAFCEREAPVVCPHACNPSLPQLAFPANRYYMGRKDYTESSARNTSKLSWATSRLFLLLPAPPNFAFLLRSVSSLLLNFSLSLPLFPSKALWVTIEVYFVSSTSPFYPPPCSRLSSLPLIASSCGNLVLVLKELLRPLCLPPHLWT